MCNKPDILMYITHDNDFFSFGAKKKPKFKMSLTKQTKKIFIRLHFLL